MAVTYRVLVGIDYPTGRCEAGEETSALPPKSIKWLLEDGLIQPSDEPLREFVVPAAVVVTEVTSPDPDAPAKPVRGKASSATLSAAEQQVAPTADPTPIDVEAAAEPALKPAAASDAPKE